MANFFDEIRNLITLTPKISSKGQGNLAYNTLNFLKPVQQVAQPVINAGVKHVQQQGFFTPQGRTNLNQRIGSFNFLNPANYQQIKPNTPQARQTIKNATELGSNFAGIGLAKAKLPNPLVRKIHPGDANELMNIIPKVQAKGQQPSPQQLKDLQVMTDRYLPKQAATATTPRLAGMFDEILANMKFIKSEKGGIGVPKAFRTPIQKDLSKALAKAKFTDINFGTLSDSKFAQLNEVRKSLGQPLLQNRELIIPTNVVKKLATKINPNMSPDEIADIAYSALHNKSSRVLSTKYPHIQASIKPKMERTSVGFLSVNPKTGETVVKSVYERGTKRLPNLLGQKATLGGGEFPPSTSRPAAPPISDVQSNQGNIIIKGLKKQIIGTPGIQKGKPQLQPKAQLENARFPSSSAKSSELLQSPIPQQGKMPLVQTQKATPNLKVPGLSGSDSGPSGIGKIGKITPPESSDSLLSNISGKINQLYTQTVDKFHPLSKLGKAAKNEQGIRNALTEHYGVPSKAEYQIQFKYKPILDSVDPKDFNAYRIAQRDVELAGRGVKGSSAQEGQRVIKELQGKYGDLAPLEEAAQKYYGLRRDLVNEYLVDTGVISKESAEAMFAKNQRYTPFKRVMDQVDEFLGLPVKRNPASLGSQNVIKGIKGSDKQIVDPFVSDVEDIYKMVAVGTRNKTARAIVALKDQLPEGVITPFKGEVGRNPVISVLENGKVQKYRVPTDVAEAAKGLEEEAINAIIKILSLPTQVLRATATAYNPSFLIPNVARDLQSAFVNAGMNPLKFVSGLAHLIKKDDVYQEFLKAGGKTSRVAIDKADIESRVATLTQRGVVPKKPGDIIRILQKMGEYSEQPTRIAAFEKTLKEGLEQGLSQQEASVRAANMAQEATVNFARTGAKTKSVNMLLAFFNARLQGADRMFRTLKKDPVGGTFRLALISQAPAVALYLYNKGFASFNDDRVVSKRDKENNFIFMLGDSPISALGGAQYLKIPKGDVGKFANPTEAFLKYLDEGGDNEALAEIGKTFLNLSPAELFTPNPNTQGQDFTGHGLIPTAIKPFVETATNKDLFSGYDIVPEYKKNLPAKYQYGNNTSPFFKMVGDVTGQSPANLEHLSGGYTTAFSRYFQQFIGDPLAKAVDKKYETPKLEQGAAINKTPIASRFLGGERRTQEEQALTNESRAKALQFRINDVKGAIKRGDMPADEGYKQIKTIQEEISGLGGSSGGSSKITFKKPKTVKLKQLKTPKAKKGRKIKAPKLKFAKVKGIKVKKIKTPKLAQVKKYKIKKIKQPKYAKIKGLKASV